MKTSEYEAIVRDLEKQLVTPANRRKLLLLIINAAPKIPAQKTIRIAKQYAALSPEHGQVDMNAAIVLAKALLRVLKNQGV